jgi:hypothetical protein
VTAPRLYLPGERHPTRGIDFTGQTSATPKKGNRRPRTRRGGPGIRGLGEASPFTGASRFVEVQNKRELGRGQVGDTLATRTKQGDFILYLGRGNGWREG